MMVGQGDITNETAVKVEQATKHEQMWETIQGISGVKRHLSELLTKIRDEDNVTADESTVNGRPPSLEDVFHVTQEYLDVNYKEMHIMIENIYSSLFVSTS